MEAENKKPRNPNAFPTPMETAYEFNEDGQTLGSQEGMTLRDYFAAKAMQQPTSYKPGCFYQWIKWFFGFNYTSNTKPHDVNAEQAYGLADAMLKQRDL